MSIDYDYLSMTLSNLSGIPVRLYREGVFQKLYYTGNFKPDLAILEEQHISHSAATVSYHLTEQFLLFGLFRVKAEPVSFILGPVTQSTPDRARVRDILRSIGEPMDRDTELLNYLRSIPNYPLQNFLQILCSFDYFINEEKTSVGDLLLEDISSLSDPQLTAPATGEDAYIHNTYDLEIQMLADVEYGRSDNIKEMIRGQTVGRAGKMAQDTLRQEKNLLICTATLLSRAAIRGGMPTEDALSLSDLYIQKTELLNDYTALTRLSSEMVLDFTMKVERLRAAGAIGALSRAIRTYVLQNINHRITTDELARYLNLSRTYLCKRFKEETNQSIAGFITVLRVDEAKRLLAVSKKPLGEIAENLGFSSQSHFQNIFKQQEGVTPNEYRVRSEYSFAKQA